MKIKKNLALSDTGFVFNPSTGDSFNTNPIGLEIIRLLREDVSLAGIKSTVLKKYMVDPTSFEKDLDDFLGVLGRLKLIEGHEEA